MAEVVEHPRGITRRRMVGILIAGPTLIAAARWGIAPAPAFGAVPTEQAVDHYDLSDLLSDSCRPTNWMITVTVNKDGTATFDLPRAEVGQGLTTSFAMVIADEMELPIDRVKVTLADARPELVYNQLTGGADSLPSLYEPVRVVSASARDRPGAPAARELGVPASPWGLKDGVFTARGGAR